MTQKELETIIKPTYGADEKVVSVEISIPEIVTIIDGYTENCIDILEILSRENANNIVVARYLFREEYFLEAALEKLELVQKKQVLDRNIMEYLVGRIVKKLEEIEALKEKYL